MSRKLIKQVEGGMGGYRPSGRPAPEGAAAVVAGPTPRAARGGRGAAGMGRIDRRLIEEVERAEVAAREKADVARAEILKCEIRHRIEGGKPMTETGEKTGGKTVGETGPRRRRRFTPEAPDTMPAEPVATSDSDSNWQDKDRAGYFSGRPGPGRGHTADGVGAWGTGAGGEGGSDLDLLKELVGAIERRGPRWFDDLIKTSPIVSAQLLSCLRKTEPTPGQSGGGVVNVLMGEHLSGIAESILAPRVPDDVADLDLDTARQEVKRLRDENKRLMDAANNTTPPRPKADDKPIMAESPPGPPVECLQCRRLNYPGRMIQPGQKCRWGCGQWYQDAAEGRETPAPPDPDELARQASSGIAMCITAGPEAGWVRVADLSTASIRDALAVQGRRGL